MQKLNPVEYHYVASPFTCDGQELLKLTLQYLCLKDVIQIEQRWIAINKRERRKRARFFFKRGPQFEAYATESEAEKFVLELFQSYPEFRFYVLRHYIKNQFGKLGTDPFKSDYVLKDVRKKGLTLLWYFPSMEALNAKSYIKSQVKYINESVDRLVKNHPKELGDLLHQIGENILLLESETIDKINTVSEDIKKIKDLTFFEVLSRSFATMDVFFASDFGGFDGGFDGGGFDGFDGGDFGGGGVGGDW